MSMSYQINQASVDNVRAMLGELADMYKSVMTTSINKTLSTVQTQATARIGNELNLTAARIKQDMTITKANYGNISGKLSCTGEPIGLMQYGAKQTTKGVSVKVKRSGARALLKHAFIADANGYTHVWWREGQDQQDPPKIHMQGKISKAAWPRFGIRYHPRFSDEYRIPLERLNGPRIEDILDDDDILTPVIIQGNYLFLQNVGKQTDEILRRFG